MAANTHEKYVIKNNKKKKKWFRDRPSALRHTYRTCPGVFCLKREAEETSKNFLINKNETMEKTNTCVTRATYHHTSHLNA
jgi:hypothetical protein